MSTQAWQAHPAGWLSNNYRVEEDGKIVGTLEFRAWSEHGALELGGRRFTVARQGFWNPKFRLMDGPQLVATGYSAGTFRRGFTIAQGDEVYNLDPSSWGSRAFVLTRRGQCLGQIRTVGFSGSRAHGELDVELSRELRQFVFWMVCLAWRRAG